MKNSKEYAQEIRKLHRALKRKYPKPVQPAYEDPIEAVVYAILSAELTKPETEAALKRFSDYFVDLNDLRVSRAEEIVDLLGDDSPTGRDIAMSLTRALGSVYNKYHTVSLRSLTKIGKKPARQILEKFNGVTEYVIDYCMLTALQGHAIPLTRKMTHYLTGNNFVDPEADEQQIKGFLTRQISARNAYEFYTLLRKAGESPAATRKKKVSAKEKTVKITTKRKK
jgi:endonuclease III